MKYDSDCCRTNTHTCWGCPQRLIWPIHILLALLVVNLKVPFQTEPLLMFLAPSLFFSLVGVLSLSVSFFLCHVSVSFSWCLPFLPHSLYCLPLTTALSLLCSLSDSCVFIPSTITAFLMALTHQLKAVGNCSPKPFILLLFFRFWAACQILILNLPGELQPYTYWWNCIT